jgi:hypothetical protein
MAQALQKGFGQAEMMSDRQFFSGQDVLLEQKLQDLRSTCSQL